MDLFSITVVMSRFFALYMLASATFSIPTALALTNERRMGFRFGFDNFVLTATALAYVTVALLLLVYAKRFARYVTRGLSNPDVQVSKDNIPEVQAVAFSLLGGYVLSYALPSLVKIITLYLAPTFLMNDDMSYSPANRGIPTAYLTEAIAQLALGIWLLFGSRGITKVIRKGWDRIKAE